MNRLIGILASMPIGVSGMAQAPVEPVIMSNAEAEGRVATVEIKPHFVTAIRVPAAVRSVAVGDPKLFQIEHSPHEPNVVFVKALTTEPAESNLLISVGGGKEISLLVLSHGAGAKTVDFLVKYRRPESFLIAPDYPSELVGETVPAAQADGRTASSSSTPASPGTVAKPAALATETDPSPETSGATARPSALDALLVCQEHAPLPQLYGEHPGIPNTRGDHVRAGVSEVIDGGQQVIVLFSAVNPLSHAILLVPPQVELGGKIRRGKIFGHSVWTASEELSVEEFRLSKRRIGPGERADGVVIFERPPYKQSNETLFLQIAEAGAIDKPALVPFGFGVNILRDREVNDATRGR